MRRSPPNQEVKSAAQSITLMPCNDDWGARPTFFCRKTFRCRQIVHSLQMFGIISSFLLSIHKIQFSKTRLTSQSQKSGISCNSKFLPHNHSDFSGPFCDLFVISIAPSTVSRSVSLTQKFVLQIHLPEYPIAPLLSQKIRPPPIHIFAFFGCFGAKKNCHWKSVMPGDSWCPHQMPL